MRRLVMPGCLLLGPLLMAQDPTPPPPTTPPTAAERLQELEAMQEQLVKDWRDAVAAARKASENAQPGTALPAIPMRPDFGPIAVKAMAYATEHAGTPEAASFLVIVLQNGKDQTLRATAMQALLDDHLDSEELAQLGGMFPYLSRIVGEDGAAGAMERLSKSGNGAVRGWAALAMHKGTIAEADRESETYAFARKVLLKVAEEVDDERLDSEIRSAIDLREKYGPGNVAPDVAGVDLDGVAFQLSDYRGKVLFLDFWGDW